MDFSSLFPLWLFASWDYKIINVVAESASVTGLSRTVQLSNISASLLWKVTEDSGLFAVLERHLVAAGGKDILHRAPLDQDDISGARLCMYPASTRTHLISPFNSQFTRISTKPAHYCKATKDFFKFNIYIPWTFSILLPFTATLFVLFFFSQ